MSPTGFLLLTSSAAMTMAANLLLRAGIIRAGGFRPDKAVDIIFGLLKLFLQPMFTAGFIAYFLAAVIWFRIIAFEPLSVAYPVLVGLTFVLVTIGALFVFREPISLQKVLGLAVILGGIVIASSGSSVKVP